MNQMMLFEPTDEEKLWDKLESLDEKYNALRKGQYAKITKLQGEVQSLIEQVEFLQSSICRKGYYE